MGIEGNNPDVLKLVGYYGEISHVSSHRGLYLKDVFYRRAAPCFYNKEILNYELDVAAFEALV